MKKRERRNIDKNELFDILNKIKNNSKEFYQNSIVYNYNGILIYIKNKIPLSSNERYKKLYTNRRKNGLCVRCGKPTQVNPSTNKLYRFCEEHRLEELNKKRQERVLLKDALKKYEEKNNS